MFYAQSTGTVISGRPWEEGEEGFLSFSFVNCVNVCCFQAVVVTKYLFQFGFFPWNDGTVQESPFYPPRILGIEQTDNYANVDIALLLALFIHRSILKVGVMSGWVLLQAASYILCGFRRRMRLSFRVCVSCQSGSYNRVGFVSGWVSLSTPGAFSLRVGLTASNWVLLRVGACFRMVLLQGGACFRMVLLQGGACFRMVLLQGGACFRMVLLQGGACFRMVLLQGGACFRMVLLQGGACFRMVLLQGGACFRMVLLQGGACFRMVLLQGGACFRMVLLHGGFYSGVVFTLDVPFWL